MTRHGRLGLAALALLAVLIFVPSAFAAVTNQQVQWSGGAVTWTGGDANSPNAQDDAVTIAQTGDQQITINTTSATQIDLFADTDTTDNCDYGDDNATVICDNVTSFQGNAQAGDDTVDASQLTSIPATLDGLDGNDALSGGGVADTINGDNENDTINGGAGNDSEYGGLGDDTINGGGGDDTIQGDGVTNGAVVAQSVIEGNDTLNGDDGVDNIHGNGGDDTINGGAGDDASAGVPGGLYGDAGADTINGGDGTDYADGGTENDLINGDGGDDRFIFVGFPKGPSAQLICCFFFISGGLNGGPGDDTINGGDGIDSAYGDTGEDTIHGDAGDDGGFGGFGPAGLCLGPCSGLDGGPDTDHVFGDAGDDNAQGGAGDDEVNGGDGNDQLWGDCQNSGCFACTELCDEGPGNDIVTGDAGDDQIHGEEGDDHLNGADGSDDLYGGDGADAMSGGAGDDNVIEYEDNAPDTAGGGAGTDDLYYSAQGNPVSLTLDDVANDGEAADPGNEDPGDPNNNYGSDMDNVHFYDNYCNGCQTGGGGATPVTIVGTSEQNLLFGSDGDDDITGGAGADYMSGGDGADTFHARDGYPDYIDCDDGVDTAIVDQFDTVHNCENVDLANVPSAFDTSQPPPSPPVPPAGPAANTPPDGTPPVLGLDVPKTTFTADQLVAGVKVSFSCNEDCKLNLRLLAQQSSGKATFSRAKGYNVVVGRRTVGFGKSKRNVTVRPCERKQGGPQSKACLARFKKSLNARLAKTGKVTMKLIAVTEDRAGNRSQKTKTITIRKRVR